MCNATVCRSLFSARGQARFLRYMYYDWQFGLKLANCRKEEWSPNLTFNLTRFSRHEHLHRMQRTTWFPSTGCSERAFQQSALLCFLCPGSWQGVLAVVKGLVQAVSIPVCLWQLPSGPQCSRCVCIYHSIFRYALMRVVMRGVRKVLSRVLMVQGVWAGISWGEWQKSSKKEFLSEVDKNDLKLMALSGRLLLSFPFSIELCHNRFAR